MSELAHRRQSRDLWISRGHLRAAAAGAVLLSAASFLGGYVVGRAHAPSPPPPVDDEALIDLLARIEASARPDAAVEELTFPEVLKEPPPAPPTPTPAFTARLELGAEADAAAASERLQAAGFTAVVRTVARDGAPAWEVTFGSWPSAAAAGAGVEAARAAGFPGAVVAPIE